MCLLTMWDSQGLFHRAILASCPIGVTSQSREIAPHNAVQLCEAAGVGSIALASLSVTQITTAKSKLAMTGTTRKGMHAILGLYSALLPPGRMAIANRFTDITGSVDTITLYRHRRADGGDYDLLGDVIPTLIFPDSLGGIPFSLDFGFHTGAIRSDGKGPRCPGESRLRGWITVRQSCV